MRRLDTVGWTLADYAAAYADGATVTAVITAVLDALDALDDPTVLIGGPLRELALAAAGALDAARGGGPGTADMPGPPRAGGSSAGAGAGAALAGPPSLLPLFGVPVVVKDNIDVAGVPTTAACPGFAYVPATDATAVAALRRAGAIVVAKTNMDQFATGLVGTRSPYGTPRNPIDAALVPGGSSSGSAVAVARGLVPLALGTDTAGSGRVPAALNHVVGLKPTIGRVGTAGVVPAVRRADCVSVFALTVTDADAAAAAIAGGDDGTTRAPHWRPGPALRPRVGVPSDLDLPPAARASVDLAVELLTGLGAEVVGVAVQPFLDAGGLLYGGPLVAERTAAVGAFLADPTNVSNDVVRSIILAGDAYLATDAYRTEYDLDLGRRRFEAALDGLTCLVLPTVPAPATLAEVAAQPYDANRRLGTYTTFANLLDTFALAVPLGLHQDGPASVQLIGPAWSDLAIASLGAALQVAAGGPLGATGRPQPAPAHRPAPAGVRLAVVGAHLRGQPLHHQLSSRGAQLLAATTTSSDYRLHALATTPAKPGLVRVSAGGAPIAVEVWALDERGFGSFVAEVPPPLCIGTVELADGSTCPGFLAEPWALEGAPDITAHGGWLNYLAAAT